jgi:hypothetical protein
VVLGQTAGFSSEGAMMAPVLKPSVIPAVARSLLSTEKRRLHALEARVIEYSVGRHVLERMQQHVEVDA